MIAGVATDLLYVALAAVLAITIYLMLRARVVIAPSLLTRVFGYVMSAHAFLNLVTRNASGEEHSLLAVIVANVTALIFLATYLNVLRRHHEGPILAGLSLALGSSCAVFVFIASGQLPPSREIALSTVLTASLSLLVLWRVARVRVPDGRSVGVSR
jgi:hypothetical protein